MCNHSRISLAILISVIIFPSISLRHIVNYDKSTLYIFRREIKASSAKTIPSKKLLKNLYGLKIKKKSDPTMQKKLSMRKTSTDPGATVNKHEKKRRKIK